jgi:peptidoglycan/xylan/chitin deacetylase (PgdA/CDA1 family)
MLRRSQPQGKNLVRLLVNNLGNLFSPQGSHAKLTILIYHRVLSRQDPLNADEITEPTFDWHMSILSKYFNTLPLGSAIQLLQRQQLPSRSVCVTFDDGYADNVTNALPILLKWKIPATFFIATGFLNGGIMWNDVVIESLRNAQVDTLDLNAVELPRYALNDDWNERRRIVHDIISKIKYLSAEKRNDLVQYIAQISNSNLPTDMMMTSDQVVKLQECGMEIGGHTTSHPVLSRINADSAKEEILGGKKTLENMLGKPISLFAYPNGKPGKDYLREHKQLVRECGFKAAVSTAYGTASRHSDLFQLPRFTPWDKTTLRFLFRTYKNYFEKVESV